jgi:hypothetical protein
MTRRSGWTLSLALLTLVTGTLEAQRATVRERRSGWVELDPAFRSQVRMLGRQAEMRARMRATELRARAQFGAMLGRQRALQDRTFEFGRLVRERALARVQVRPFLNRRYFRRI